MYDYVCTRYDDGKSGANYKCLKKWEFINALKNLNKKIFVSVSNFGQRKFAPQHVHANHVLWLLLEAGIHFNDFFSFGGRGRVYRHCMSSKSALHFLGKTIKPKSDFNKPAKVTHERYGAQAALNNFVFNFKHDFFLLKVCTHVRPQVL